MKKIARVFQEPTYDTLLTIGADTPVRLRRDAVYRVVDASHETGCLEGFCDWLRAQRPDLTDEIDACRAEIGGDEEARQQRAWPEP